MKKDVVGLLSLSHPLMASIEGISIASLFVLLHLTLFFMGNMWCKMLLGHSLSALLTIMVSEISTGNHNEIHTQVKTPPHRIPPKEHELHMRTQTPHSPTASCRKIDC